MWYLTLSTHCVVPIYHWSASLVKKEPGTQFIHLKHYFCWVRSQLYGSIKIQFPVEPCGSGRPYEYFLIFLILISTCCANMQLKLDQPERESSNRQFSAIVQDCAVSHLMLQANGFSEWSRTLQVVLSGSRYFYLNQEIMRCAVQHSTFKV